MKKELNPIEQFTKEIEKMLSEFQLYISSLVGSITGIKKEKGGTK